MTNIRRDSAIAGAMTNSANRATADQAPQRSSIKQDLNSVLGLLASPDKKLTRAARQGDIKQMTQALAEGAKPDKGVRAAAIQRDPAAMKLLLAHGADPNEAANLADICSNAAVLRAARQDPRFDVEQIESTHTRTLLKTGPRPPGPQDWARARAAETLAARDPDHIDPLAQPKLISRKPIGDALAQAVPPKSREAAQWEATLSGFQQNQLARQSEAAAKAKTGPQES